MMQHLNDHYQTRVNRAMARAALIKVDNQEEYAFVNAYTAVLAKGASPNLIDDLNATAGNLTPSQVDLLTTLVDQWFEISE